MNRRMCPMLAAAVALLPIGPARAGITQFGVEYDQFDRNPTVADGVLGANEYQWHSQYFTGSGAGGVLTGPTSRLYFSSSDQGIVLGFQPGAALGGTLVVMVDAGAGGGRSAGSGPGLTAINDQGDAARSAVSALRGRYPTTTVFDDRYEFAVTFNTDGGHAWRMPGDAEGLLTPLGGYIGPGGSSTAFREALIPMGNGWGSVGGFTLFAAYVGANGFVFNEAAPGQPFSSGANPGSSMVDFVNAALVAEFIPGPGTGAVLVGPLFCLCRRRRR